MPSLARFNPDVALDQFVFAPFAIALFFGCTTLMEGKSVEDVKRKLDTSYKDTMVANWGLFIPFQTINMSASQFL
ncbi:Protein required for ethanol metabolism [Ceratobasidium sp. 395]|nr:Protein required for ethanol metabolism [Ceratobasidium sp. 395]